ncbi:MAG: hypothetical protein LBQ48_05080 [Oscillospiraceae bacterium]|nr:hypothetical protein [Oscillospiraceae bacterium]
MINQKKINRLRKIRKWFCGVFFSAALLVMRAQTAFADEVEIAGDGGEISKSKIATGTEKLLKDATAWLMIIAPIVAVLAIIYFLIRKGMSEELDHKKWNTRIIVALVSSLGAVLAAVIVNLLMSYYQ